MNESQQFLAGYVKERLPQLIPGFYEGSADIPHFTVDQRSRPLKETPYPL